MFKKKSLFLETNQIYLQRLKKYDPKKDQWIYDILLNFSQEDKIIYKDSKFCLLPSTSKYEKKEIHFIAIPYDLKLRSLRSLSQQNIPLLIHINEISRQILKEKYKRDDLIAEIHYPPSTYHLHIHFYTKKKAETINPYRRHSLENIITNLLKKNNYYKYPIIIPLYI